MAAGGALSPAAMTTDAWPILATSQTFPRQRSNRTRFFPVWLRERIAPVTHQDQAISDGLPLPWRLGRPRKAWVPLRVQSIAQTHGYRFPGANPWLAHVAGDPPDGSGDGERHPIQAKQMMVAKIRPMPGALVSKVYSGRSPTLSCRRFSSRSISGRRACSPPRHLPAASSDPRRQASGA